MLRPPPTPPLFPYTTLFRSLLQASGSASSFKDYLQTRWRTLHQRYGRGRGFDDFWSDALQHGGVYTDVAVQSPRDRKSTRLNSSHVEISYAVFCLKQKTGIP